MAMTPEQERALALAAASARIQQQGAGAPTDKEIPIPLSEGGPGPLIRFPDGNVMTSRGYIDLPEDEREALKAQAAASDPLTNVRDVESSLLDPLAQGLHYGWSDEARGAVAGMQGQDPTFATDEARAALEHERYVNPAGSMGAEMAGGVITSLLATKALGASGMAIPAGTTLPQRIGIGSAVGAAGGALYGAGAADGDLQDRAEGARNIGLLGGALGAAGPVVGQAFRRIISPNPSTSAQKVASALMKREGVTLTAGQQTGKKGLQYLEAELGKGRAADLMEQQAEEFTAATLKRAGVQAKRATPEVLDQTFEALGQQFDNMAANTSSPFDKKLQDSLLDVVTDYADSAGTPAAIVERMVNRAGELARANGGQLTGEAYKELRSTIGRFMTKVDPATKGALHDIQEALDDAVERNMGSDMLDAWSELRRKYRNLLVIENASTAAGEAAASGIITPAALRAAAKAVLGRRSVARGKNDFSALANAGVQTMSRLPQSGTAPRIMARAVGSLPAMLGAGVGSTGGLPGAMIGAAVGGAVPWAIGRTILSKPGRKYLSNQLNTAVGPTAIERVTRALSAPYLGSSQ